MVPGEQDDQDIDELKIGVAMRRAEGRVEFVSPGEEHADDPHAVKHFALFDHRRQRATTPAIAQVKIWLRFTTISSGQ